MIPAGGARPRGGALSEASLSTLSHPGIAFVPITDGAPTAELLLVWRRDDDREVTRAFVDTARAVARRRSLPPVLLSEREPPNSQEPGNSVR